MPAANMATLIGAAISVKTASAARSPEICAGDAPSSSAARSPDTACVTGNTAEICCTPDGRRVAGYKTPPSSQDALPNSHRRGSPRLSTRTKVAAVTPMVPNARGDNGITSAVDTGFTSTARPSSSPAAIYNAASTPARISGYAEEQTRNVVGDVGVARTIFRAPVD